MEQKRNGFFASDRVRGCALGCLAVVVLVVLVAAGLYYWAVTPGPQVPSYSFIGTETVGVIHLQGFQEDPAVQALTAKLIMTMQELRDETLAGSDAPRFLEFFTGGQREPDAGEAKQALRDVPKDVTVNFELVPGLEPPQWIAVGNMSRFPRALRFIYQLAATYKGGEQVRGHAILRLNPDDPFHLAFVEDTLLFAESGEVLRLVLGREVVAEPVVPVSTLAAVFASRQERWNIYGTLENRQGALAWALDQLAAQNPKIPSSANLLPVLERITRVDLGLDVADEDSLEGFVELICTSPEHATEIGSLIDGFVRLSGTDPHFSVVTKWTGETVRIGLQVREFSHFVIEALEGKGNAGSESAVPDPASRIPDPGE